VVRSYEAVKAVIVVCLDDSENIKGAALCFMSRFLKASFSRDFNISYMSEVDSVCKGIDKIDNIVFRVNSKRAAAKGKTVVFAVVKL